MLTPVRSAQFKRDVRKAEKRGKDLGKLRVLLTSLIQQKPLSARYVDHPLRGLGAVIGRPILSRTGS